MNNIPENIEREIVERASPRTLRKIARVTTAIPYTRRTLPIGLSVTKVGAPKYNIKRPPVINRSVAKAKPYTLRSSTGEIIDTQNPLAYKNPHWKFYVRLDLQHVLFKNTPNGPAYLINKKTGQRRESNPARLDFFPALGPQNWTPRTNKHTWSEYLKRASKQERYNKGSSQRRLKKERITENVNAYMNGNNRALNKWSLPNLAWWVSQSNMMTYHGRPYIHRGGQWYRTNNFKKPLTKQEIIYNIRRNMTMNNNYNSN